MGKRLSAIGEVEMLRWKRIFRNRTIKVASI